MCLRAHAVQVDEKAVIPKVISEVFAPNKTSFAIVNVK